MPKSNLRLNREVNPKYRESVKAAQSVLDEWPSKKKRAKKLYKNAKRIRADLKALRQDIRNLLKAQTLSEQTVKKYKNMLAEAKRYCRELQKRRKKLRKKYDLKKN